MTEETDNNDGRRREIVRDAGEMVRGGGGIFGFIGNVLMAPVRAIGGFFSGIFSGISLLAGGALLAINSWRPEWLDTAIGYVRDQMHMGAVADFLHEKLRTGSDSSRMLWSGLLGAGIGGGFNGVMEGISGIFGGGNSRGRDQDNGGGLINFGTLAMTAAVVGIGAVLINQVQHTSDGSQPVPPPRPQGPGGPQLPVGTH